MIKKLPIDGFSSYFIGSNGVVYSEKQTKTREMKPFEDDRGYLRVNLMKDGKRYYRKVHLLVISAFHGLRPINKEARHLDGNKKNNSADNLAWGTHIENTSIDKERFRKTKLNKMQVRVIRRVGKSIHRHTLAKMFGVCDTTISNIINNRHWTWI